MGVQGRPLRIGIFHTTLPEPGRKLGGVEVAVHRLANALVRSGEEVTVLSLSPRPSDALYEHQHLFPQYPWLVSRRLARLFVLPFFLNFVAWNRFDVVHLHGDDWFLFRRKVTTLRTLNGSALQEARSATSFPRRLLQYLLYPCERLSVYLCTQPLALGTDTAAIYGIRSVVNYGVDIKLFHPGEKLPKPRILFVGTWQGRKRGQFIFDLFVKEILPCFPQAELCMVSDTCPEHPNVIAEVFPSDEVLAQRYREAWVFAYPSTYEGFGIAYLEAMASGTPVLCSPNSGASYVLAQGSYGAIVEDDAFAARLRELLENQETRLRMAEAGRERAEEFAWSAIAQQHLTFYQEAFCRKKRVGDKEK